MSGTLINNFNTTSDEQVLTLSINRLSEKLSSSFYYHSPNLNIDVLEGNLFGCENQNKLPVTDPSYQSYSYGSNDLNDTVANISYSDWFLFIGCTDYLYSSFKYIYLFVLLPFNIGYSLTNSSKYEVNYGWIITMALIDGIGPTIIYGFTLIAFFF